jgi:mono/diheme cytochrome c family protein
MVRVVILALAVALAAAVASAQDPAQPAQSAATPGPDDALNGEQIFGTSCGFCHQAGGRVAGRGPKLAGTERSDEFLLNRIRVGKEGAMPAYGRAFTEPQLKALVAYIRSLKDDAR